MVRKTARRNRENVRDDEIAGIHLSHPGRVLMPINGITKCGSQKAIDADAVVE
jgi:hypothetical protein